MGAPPYLIGVVGGSGSGKTTFSTELAEQCGGMEVSVLSQDNYYMGLNQSDDPATYNFDRPAALDLDRMSDDINCLKSGDAVHIPSYDFTTHQRREDSTLVCPADVIIAEGLFLFTHKEMRELFDLKIFLHVPTADRLARRLDRDVMTRGRSRDKIVRRFNEHCEPAYHDFISPSSIYADLKITPAAGFGPLYDKQISDVIDRLLEK